MDNADKFYNMLERIEILLEAIRPVIIFGAPEGLGMRLA
jgi:hypothetical protein